MIDNKLSIALTHSDDQLSKYGEIITKTDDIESIEGS
jgi:hypothetical protein